jgi:CheY-like chemotaxis protein
MVVQEQLQRLVGEQYPLVVRTAQGVDIDGYFYALDADRGRLMVELKDDPPSLQPDEPLTLFFHRNGQRWSLGTALHHFPRPTSLVLIMPSELKCADRRQDPRCTLPEGRITVTARTALYDGLSFEGNLLSLSPNGLSFRVESVEGPAGKLNWRRGLLEPGRGFEAIQISGLPFGIEGEGRLLWVEEDRIGIRLRGLVNEAKESLAAFVQKHIAVPPTTLELGQATFREVASAPLEPPDRSQALLRLKKRGRAIVLAMKSGHLRDALQGILREWGYGRVDAVDNLAQWLELSQNQSVDLVFIDGGLKELRGIELASFLHQARGEKSYAIVLAEQLMGTSLGIVAKRAGVTQLLDKPYTRDKSLDIVLESVLDLRPLITEEVVATPSARHKRKAVALAMPPGSRRDALQAFLLGEGFCRVLPAGTVGELIQALQSPTLGLVFVDWDDTRLTGLEVAAFLAAQHGATHPQFVLVGDPARFDDEARALGISRIIPRSYALSGQLTDLLLEVMESFEAVS